MNNFQREVLQQIKAGIDRARHEGVVVEYPRGALIDGEWVAWPFDGSAPERCGAPLDADGVDKCERTKGHTGVCGLDPV